jgi:hypothetical protein
MAMESPTVLCADDGPHVLELRKATLESHGYSVKIASRVYAAILVAAVVGTQVIAILIAVYGIFMAPIGWGWALFIWGYALAWFLVNDRIKLAAYRVFDPQERGLLGRLGTLAKHEANPIS